MTAEGTTILNLLREGGPLTGAELQEKSELEPLQLWRFCKSTPDVAERVVAQHYLRFDRNVEGYARLSPSIRREFLTYTVLDYRGATERLDDRARSLAEEIVRISDAKRRLAANTVATVVDGLPHRDEITAGACFVLAGDIVYGMAHRVPRPERSTGRLVCGSDLDIVVVTSHGFSEEAKGALDDAILQRKHLLLVNPSYREELDYLIKDLATVQTQVSFDTFEHMVACKILDEGEYLYGSRDVFADIIDMLRHHGIPERIAQLRQAAFETRAAAERTLRKDGGESPRNHYLNLFYTTDESDEIY